MYLWGAGSSAGGQRPFEIVDDGQQFLNERGLLRGGSDFTVLASAPFEILEVSRQTQVQILLMDEFGAQRVQLGACGLAGVGSCGARQGIVDSVVH